MEELNQNSSICTKIRDLYGDSKVYMINNRYTIELIKNQYDYLVYDIKIVKNDIIKITGEFSIVFNNCINSLFYFNIILSLNFDVLESNIDEDNQEDLIKIVEIVKIIL